MSDTRDVVDGLARMLVTATVATYRSDGSPYLASETGVLFKDLTSTPDRVVVLNAYGTADDNPQWTLGRRLVQARFRGTADPLDVDALADAAFNVWHGATNLTFGSVHVVQILRVSSIPLGRDEQDLRWQRADNYALDLDYPTTANRPI